MRQLRILLLLLLAAPAALAAYKAAYEEKDEWDFRALIKPCLKAPCVGEKYPGRFSPY